MLIESWRDMEKPSMVKYGMLSCFLRKFVHVFTFLDSKFLAIELLNSRFLKPKLIVFLLKSDFSLAMACITEIDIKVY